MAPDSAPYQLAGVLMRSADPHREAGFWSSVMNSPAVKVEDGDPRRTEAGVHAIVECGDGLALFFASGPQKPPTMINPSGSWSGKSSVHICWATDDAAHATQHLQRLRADVHVSADRGISFLVFTSPHGKVDGCLLEEDSWDLPPADSWKQPIGNGHWIAFYYLTIDSPDIAPAHEPSNPDAATLVAEYGHGQSAQYWQRLVGGEIVPYTGDALGSYPFYVPLVNPQSAGGTAGPTRTVLFQRVQDGNRYTPLPANWVVPVVGRASSAVERGGVDDDIQTMTDPYRNEIAMWPRQLLIRPAHRAGAPERPEGAVEGF